MDSIEQQSGNGTSSNGNGSAGATPLRREAPRWLRHHLTVLVAVDVVAGAGATLLSQFIAFGLQHAELEVRGVRIPYTLAILAVVPTWVTLLATSGSYDIAPFGTPAGEVRRVVNAGTQFLALMAVAYYILHLEQLGRDFMVAIVPLAMALTLAGRAVARLQLLVQRSQGHAARRAVVMGPRHNTTRLLDHLAEHPGAGIVPVAALVPEGGDHVRFNGSDVPIAGGPDDAVAVLTSTDADLLLLTGNLGPGELRTLTWSLEGSGIEVLVAPTLTQLVRPLQVRPIAGLPLLYVDRQEFGDR